MKKIFFLLIALSIKFSFIAQVTSTVKIPIQTGNAGKFLTTNGTLLSWGTPAGGTVALSAIAPLYQTSGTFSIQPANTSQSGALSNIDWDTFNNKQSALVSGTNIKTVNGSTLLGSGNLAVGDALVANTLAQFTSTTSAGFATVISDETGTGQVVLATQPTFTTDITTPIIKLGETSGRSWKLITRSSVPTFAVPVLMPQTSGQFGILDICPNGTVTEGSDGTSWIDVVDTDCSTTNPAMTVARVATHLTYNEFGSRAMNGATSKPLSLVIDGTRYLTVQTDGNILAPNGANASTWIKQSNNSSGVSAAAGFFASATADGSFFTYGNGFSFDSNTFKNKTQVGNNYGGVILAASSSTGTIQFITGGNTLSTHNRMTISSTGSVSIGVASASAKFDVKSAGNTTGFNSIFQNSSGTNIIKLRDDGFVIQKAMNSAIADADLAAGQMAWYINEATDELILKVKYSNGSTVKTIAFLLP